MEPLSGKEETRVAIILLVMPETMQIMNLGLGEQNPESFPSGGVVVNAEPSESMSKLVARRP